MVKLELKVSTIPKAGNGLFTLEDVKQGEILGEYSGRRFGPNKLLSSMREGYSFSTHTDVIVSPFDNCLFRYANDIVDLEQSLLRKKIVKHPHLSYNIDWYIAKDETVAAKQMAKELGNKRFLTPNFLNKERVMIRL